MTRQEGGLVRDRAAAALHVADGGRLRGRVAVAARRLPSGPVFGGTPPRARRSSQRSRPLRLAVTSRAHGWEDGCGTPVVPDRPSLLQRRRRGVGSVEMSAAPSRASRAAVWMRIPRGRAPHRPPSQVRPRSYSHSPRLWGRSFSPCVSALDAAQRAHKRIDGRRVLVHKDVGGCWVLLLFPSALFLGRTLRVCAPLSWMQALSVFG